MEQKTLRDLTEQKADSFGFKRSRQVYWKLILLGLAFAFLWSSAATATKVGLNSAQPFVISLTRFLVAGSIMLIVSHLIKRSRLPQGKEWLHLSLYGLLNISLYLGLYVVAMQNVSAGLGSLAVATNPVIITLISAIFSGYKIKAYNIMSMMLCMAGVTMVAYPLLQSSFSTIPGILTLLASMLAYSFGAIYYSRVNWRGLNILTINGWQTILGGLFLLPLMIFSYQDNRNVFDLNFWTATLWLAIPVSIGAVQLWLWLLNKDPVNASYWLFLCPVFGFFIARVIVNEPIYLYTIMGVFIVIAGLYILQKKRQ
jgi:probable blue pigment (indigoidine) exporter